MSVQDVALDCDWPLIGGLLVADWLIIMIDQWLCEEGLCFLL